MTFSDSKPRPVTQSTLPCDPQKNLPPCLTPNLDPCPTEKLTPCSTENPREKLNAVKFMLAVGAYSWRPKRIILVDYTIYVSVDRYAGPSHTLVVATSNIFMSLTNEFSAS